MEESSKPYHIEYLAADLKRRKAVNPRYSLRAYARFLGLDPSALSRMLSNKQEISPSFSLKVLQRLQLTREEKIQFLTSVSESKRKRTAMYLATAIGDPALEISLDHSGKHSELDPNLSSSILNLSSVLSHHPDSIFVMDAAGVCIYANDKAAEFLKARVTDIIGKAWRELRFAPEFLRVFEERWRPASEAGKSTESEVFVENKKNGPQCFQHILVPILDSHGKPKALLSIIRNISQHKLSSRSCPACHQVA
jgi:PAS domain S-box-containing protein